MLDFSNKIFFGDLTSRISKLNELRELNLAYNSFIGSIPPFLNFIRNLTSLVSFTVNDNPFHLSVLPRELGNLKQLQTHCTPLFHMNASIF